MISHLIVSLIVALIAIAFDSTYVDQDDLSVVTSGTSRDSGSHLCAESSWDRVALTLPTYSVGAVGTPSGSHTLSVSSDGVPEPPLENIIAIHVLVSSRIVSPCPTVLIPWF